MLLTSESSSSGDPQECIAVRIYDTTTLKLVNRNYSTQDVTYVEDLLFNILSELGVTPVYKMLFGLKLVRENNWLAPNFKVASLVSLKSKFLRDIILELRLRFRPGLINRIRHLDPVCLDLIFAQVRHDFLNFKFENLERDFVIFDPTVLKMIALDVMRSAKESQNLDFDAYLSDVNLAEFAPRSLPTWQVTAFLFKDRLGLKDSLLKTFAEESSQDSSYFKARYIEFFTSPEICEFYCSETYQVIRSRNSKLDTLRIRYSEHTNPYLFIDMHLGPHKSKLDSSSRGWIRLCELSDISQADLNDNNIILKGYNRNPILVCEFISSLDALSFLSNVDGYFRLMKRWNQNFCDKISSPELTRLTELSSHGPICHESMACKLEDTMISGTYMIRMSPKHHNRFYIDSILPSKSRLLIEIKWDQKLKKFFKIDHDCSVENEKPIIKLDEDGYHSLETLILETQIILKEDGDIYPPQQFIICLQPNEFDHFPDLLISIPKKILELDKSTYVHSKECDLPKLIPSTMIQYESLDKITSGNGFYVRQGIMSGQKRVIVKSPVAKSNKLILNLHQRQSAIKNEFDCILTPAQSRLADWPFLRHPLFAETIGIIRDDGSPLVQEFLSGQRLDEFASKLDSANFIETIERVSVQMASALLFLEERHIIHGKLRCHNVFITKSEPVEIKITDPLGTYDIRKDRSFIPPEYLEVDGQISVPTYDRSLDIWAFGTTLWQLFNRGSYPPHGIYANLLIQPPLCPNKVWTIIESCWIIDHSLRVSALRICDELHDRSSWGSDYESLNEFFNNEAKTNRAAILQRIRKLLHKLHPSRERSSLEESKTYNMIPDTDLEFNQSESLTSCLGLDDQSTSLECLKYHEQLQVGSEIGRGSSGLVRKGILTTASGVSKVALKAIGNPDSTDDLNREFNILKNLSHDNIIKTLGLFKIEQSIYLVMEYMPLGSLLSFVRLCKAKLDTLPLKKYSLGIAEGMKYLEDKKIIHRDLALRNVLLKDRENIKICDFGLAHSLGSNLEYTLKTDRPLPFRWLSPETLDRWIFSHSSDVWSYGIVLWELFSGGCCPQYPGSYITLKEVLKTERLKRPRTCPVAFYELMLSCWAYEPYQRPNFKTICGILSHKDYN